ncbi:Protein kinase [Parasponia andersonii]|uniref:Protein kinase n=1 Tax=Parasponia andersonii TaxID=3476 RepID=A0A2P5DCW7_PARAD|nr:Protein kinase [Parasponia andersonii]
MAAVSALRGGRLPLFHHRGQMGSWGSLRLRKQLNFGSNSKGFTLFARYSQAQEDLFSSSRLQDSIENLPKLVEDIVQTSINTGPRGALRMAQGIQAVLGVGGEWLADMSKSTNSSAGLPTQVQLGLLSPFYLRRLFERMGATYVKLGQFIASAPTLFPPDYVKEFQNCFDRAPSVPFDEIKRILREELGRPIESVYEYVDPTPIASASIAQVHGAKLRGSQEDVVIKVLKPGIEDILVADLNFVYVVARLLEFLNPELSRTSLVGIVKDIRESMLEEVDFQKEAANIESFRRYLEAMGLTQQATAPKVYYQCSTRRVLTMQRLYGVPLTDLDTISSLVPSPETSLITALNVWFGSLLACETFHADVHAGNLWLLRDGRIGFLDFGIVGRISPKTWAAMEVFLASIATEEYESMASALIEMGATSTDVDSKAFARDLEKIFSSIKASITNYACKLHDLDTEVVIATARGTTTSATAVSANVIVDERQMNALFLDVVRVSESYGLKFPREFALLMKQLLYFDRYTRLLAPNMNMLQDQRISIVSNRRSNYRNNFR